MPDLKTALTTALSSWEKDDQKIQQEKKVKKLPQQFMPTNNVTIETFNFVKNNPNSVGGFITDALSKRGFKRNSVGSLLTQFVKQGHMTKTPKGEYKTIIPAYTPLKASKKFKALSKPKTKVAKSEGIAALKPQGKVSTQWDAETIIDNIGLKQARALYDELKTIFGG